ncbi:MAG: ChbG/HpnK family deacetylase [Bacillota bacterium]
MLLIVNADDFGYTPAVNRGIVQAVRQGVVTSVSLMVNQPGTEDALHILRNGLPAGVGVHLCLTRGRPLLNPGDIPSLVDAEGYFKGRDALLTSALVQEEVEREFSAQVAYVQNAGIRVGHLDTHHHIHRHPIILAVLMRVAGNLRLPLRSLDDAMREVVRLKGLKTPDFFCGAWFAGGVSLPAFKTWVTAGLRIGARSMELMTHPGKVDEELFKRSGYAVERERELRILCHPELPRWLAGKDVRLGTYRNLG